MNSPAITIPASSSPSLVGSVVQAVAILRHLGTVPSGLGVTAIGRDLSISPSSCFNLMKTLVAEGLADFDPGTKRYTLGLGVAELARLSTARSDIIHRAAPAMQNLADGFDVACGLWRVTGTGRSVLVALAESDAATRIHIAVGQRQPSHAGAVGRAVLASTGATLESIAEGLALVRSQDPPGPKRYFEEIETARSRGWALDQDQLLRGVTSVASTVTDYDGTPRFAVSCTMFSGQHDARDLTAIGEGVRSIAERLTAELQGAR
jgi:IclR family acetate operon transcriptional repressor